MENRAFFTPRELAERWKVAIGTLSNWRYYGKGPQYTKIEGSILYPYDAVISCEKIDSDKKAEDELFQ